MIIIYHNIFPDSDIPKYWWAGQAIPFSIFKQHILWLTKHHRIVSLTDYLANSQQEIHRKQKLTAITFDDGLQLTYKCVSSFLTELNIPATFFVPTSHLEHGELLWFSYLDALCSEKLYNAVETEQNIHPLQTKIKCQNTKHALSSIAKTSGDLVGFCRALAKTYPIPEDIVVKYQGMTYNQLKEVGESNVLEVGAHTITHPYLDKLSPDIQTREIHDSKEILSELTKRPIRYFAYPAGEYSRETIEIVRAAKFDASFAVIPKRIGVDPNYEIGRIGIYSQSLLKFQLKTYGLVDFARRVGMRVG